MIYITGDTHGNFDRVEAFCDRFHTRKSDTLIILGDVGLNFYGDERDEQRKRFVSQLPITLLCIHGNHEMRPRTITGKYRMTFYLKGLVYVEDAYPNIFFAEDGTVFTINHHQTLVCGGAYSVDKPWRIATGNRWFSDEQPDEETKQYIENVLDFRGNHFDVFLTHTCPARFMPHDAFLEGIDQSTVDKSTEEWLDRIYEGNTFDHWFCGHYHINRKVDNVHFLFDDIIEFP